MKKLVCLSLLFLACGAKAQQVDVSDFVGRWGDFMEIDYTQDGFVCHLADSVSTSYIAVVDSCMYIEFLDLDDWNGLIIHTIYTCVLHDSCLEVAHHRYVDNLYDQDNSWREIKSVPQIYKKTKKHSTVRIANKGAKDTQIISELALTRKLVLYGNSISLIEHNHGEELKEDYYYSLYAESDTYWALADTLRYRLTLEKIADSIPYPNENYLWRLANYYYTQLSPEMSHEDSVQQIKKSIRMFEKMDLGGVTLEMAFRLSDVPFWYDFIGESHPLADAIFDSNTNYFQTYPQALYGGNDDWARLTMSYLVDTGRYSDAAEFYRAIRQNFPYDDQLNAGYIHSLMELGYYVDEDMADIALRSRVMAPDEDYHRGVCDILAMRLLSQGNLHSAVEKLSPDDTMYLESATLAMLYYYDKKYDVAFDLYQHSYGPGADSSSLMLMEGICLARMAEKEDVEPGRAARQRDMARQRFRSVIDFEARHDAIDNMPYAYLELGMPHEALVSMEKQMRDLDSLDEEFLLKAEIYAQIGEKRKAKAAIRKFLELNHDRAVCALVRVAPYLEPIRGYVDELCSHYEAEDTTPYLRRVFDTVTTTIPFTPSLGGTIYLKCTMGGREVDSLVFDTGAEVTQISSDLANQLIDDGAIDIYLGPSAVGVADGSTTVPGKVYRLSSLSFNDIVLHNIHVFVPDNAPDARMLLGSNVFGDMTITVNPRKSQLTLTRVTEKRIEQ